MFQKPSRLVSENGSGEFVISCLVISLDIHLEISQYLPLSLHRSWYKTPDDKPINAFGFDEQYLNVAETKKVIEETHDAWKKLRSGETDAGKLWTGK
jgi:hypothetical protein